MGRVGVVTLARGRHRHLARQHTSLAAGSRRPDAYVVVAMGDPDIEAADVDGLHRDVVHLPLTERLPLAAARNTGVAWLLDREVDVVVLLDVDCIAGPDLVTAYAAAVDEHPATVWLGPVTYLPPEADRLHPSEVAALDDPHPARPAPAPGERRTDATVDHFWSLSFALSAEAWQKVGGFCEDYDGYGGEDTDFARLVVAAGLDLGWEGSARAYHQHHPVSDPPVEHLADLVRNGALFCRRWGTWPMQGWFEALERTGHVVRDGDGWRRADDSV